MISVKCDQCGTEFLRLVSEVNRSIRLGRRQFCSRTCSGKAMITNIPEDKRGNVENLNAGNRRDEFSGFRKHLRCIKRRDPMSDLTLLDLKRLWEEQGAVCPITGKVISLREYRGKSVPTQASVDRIDSSRGYTKDNIQWVSLLANLAKSHWSEDEIKQFFITEA